MRTISRSEYEASCGCHRRHYWGYLYAKSGLEPKVKPLPLAFGLALHRGMEFLTADARMAQFLEESMPVEESISYAVTQAQSEFTLHALGHEALQPEVNALLEALLRGWVQIHLEPFLDEFEVISVEEEGEPIKLSDSVSLSFRADCVVRSRIDSKLYVFNWKTMASSYEDVTEQFRRDIQMWTEALAVEKMMGEPVEGCIVEGFVKGSLSKDGHFSTPLIWAYKRESPDGRTSFEWDFKRIKGSRDFVKVPVWDEVFTTGESGVKGWINWLPAQVLATRFVRSDIIRRPSQHILDEWLAQVTRRTDDEAHILESASEVDRLNYFYQVRNKWNCKGCAFDLICNPLDAESETSIQEMLDAGLLMPRVDHHQQAEKT